MVCAALSSHADFQICLRKQTGDAGQRRLETHSAHMSWFRRPALGRTSRDLCPELCEGLGHSGFWEVQHLFFQSPPVEDGKNAACCLGHCCAHESRPSSENGYWCSSLWPISTRCERKHLLFISVCFSLLTSWIKWESDASKRIILLFFLFFLSSVKNKKQPACRVWIVLSFWKNK